jgi:hypothetical protein
MAYEGGSFSSCAAGPGSTILTTPARPCGTATTRTTSLPLWASGPAVSLPQHPSTSEPLEGIPTGAHEGSRPAPVIGDNRRSGLPRTHDRTIRTAPAHCPTAPDLGDTVGFCCAHTHHTTPAPWAARNSRARRRVALAPPSPPTSQRGTSQALAAAARDRLTSGRPCPPVGIQKSWPGLPGSARRMVVEPDL